MKAAKVHPIAEAGAHGPKRLLVLDMSYSLEAIEQRELWDALKSRDVGGYFEKTWSVHPVAPLVATESRMSKFGEPETAAIDPSHVFVEGRLGRWRWLHWLPPVNLFLAQFDLYRLLRDIVRTEHISAIRAGDPLYLGMFGWLLARSAGIPLVIRINGNNERLRRLTGKPIMPRLLRFKALERWMERFVLARADWVFAPNEDNLEFARSVGAKPDRTTVISFGSVLDARHFEAPADRPSADADLRDLGVEKGKFLITVGRLIPAKYPDHLVNMLSQLTRQGNDLSLVIAGSGEMHDRLLELALQLGLRDRVILAGDRDQSWLWRVLPESAIFVSPSAGRALSEAALAALPIIAYDTDWQRDIVETGKTGILVPYRDWSGLADAASSMLKDRPWALRLGNAARLRAIAMLDPVAATEQERNVYERILAGD